MALAQIKPSGKKHSLVDDLTAFNKAAGDDLRLHVLRVLHRDAFSVTELADIFATGQSGMSHHLKVLAMAGLLSKRREGNSIFYSRSFKAATPELDDLQQQLLQLTDRLTLPTEVERRKHQIQQQRATHSRSFFEQNAESFSQQQEQIAGFSVYAEPVATLLDGLRSAPVEQALEIGPGSGHFLPALAARFNTVVALDNSQEMLDAARHYCTGSEWPQQLEQPEFVLGDTRTALEQGLQADAVVINMVLHHVPSPEELIGDVSHLLRQDGQLVIAELCDHDQEWVRGSCGDVWLGIHPDALTGWTEGHGLHEIGAGQYLSLRNGFRLQIRQFQKSAASNG